MKVGFTGTQDGMTTAQKQFVYDEVMMLSPGEAHHGCCVGADHEFDQLLDQTWVETVIGHPPLNTSKMALCNCDIFREPEEYLVRNKAIVNETDYLIAAPKGPEQLRSGTWSTVRYARQLGRPIAIIWPDGSRWYEEATSLPSTPNVG